MLTDKELIAQLETRSDLTDLEQTLLTRLAACADTIEDMCNSHKKECARLKDKAQMGRDDVKCVIRDVEENVKAMLNSLYELDQLVDERAKRDK